MKAILYQQFNQLPTLQTVPDPTPADDGVVIRVEANGICRSDWHGWAGHDPDIVLPHVPGHELAGEIVAVGKQVHQRSVGERVTVPFAVGCGTCDECTAGNQHICNNYFQPGFTAWGSFAQYVAIPHADANLVVLPESMSYVEAASLGCRFITAYRAVVAQGRVSGGEWVVVHGCGGVGLSAIMIAGALGANVIGVDINDETLALARSVGAAYGINARSEADAVEAVRELTGGGAHLSLDALGSAVTCRNSVLSLRKRGRHVQVGLMLDGDQNSPVAMDRVIAWELEILGSHGMQAHAYGPMLAMIAAGKLKPEKMITRTVTLAESGKALAEMGEFANPGVTIIDKFDA